MQGTKVENRYGRLEGRKIKRKAGAELCQAQEKLGLPMPDLPVVIFHLL